MNLRDFKTAAARKSALENILGVALPMLSGGSDDAAEIAKNNCENAIGFVQVPLGIAGPLKLQSQTYGEREYYLPLATTEGALVASVSRGCKAVTQSGGAHVATEKAGISRAPAFLVDNVAAGKEFCAWLDGQRDELEKVIAATSSHISLLSLKTVQLGCYVYVRFSFDTQDAMGMNMATIATQAAVAYIEAHSNARCVALSGNVCVDKKPNYLNMLEGRGIKVWADICLPDEVVVSVLKSSTAKLVEVHKAKVLYGSILSGTIGANSHVANVLAALFLATGQDCAHIAECSSGITQLEERNGSLYASIYVPDLVIGTIGGGTGLPTQKECLSILGLAGGDDGQNAERLAEVIGGAVLGGELSLLAALASNDLVKAHQTLARGKKSF